MGPRPTEIVSGRSLGQQGRQYSIPTTTTTTSTTSPENKSRISHITQKLLPPEQNDFEEKRRKEREELLAFLRQEKPMLGLNQLTVSRIFLWTNHILGTYGLYLLLTGHFSWGVLLFQFVYSYCGSVGTTIGAHRYWTHKAFKAKTPLRILLMCFQSITAQYSIYKWCLDHRIHHKYTDTNKDPHNSKRGFWFSHMFWTISPKHPEHAEKLRTFDMPDLERDAVVRFQSNYYPWLTWIFYNFIPVTVVTYFWGVRRWHAHCLSCLRWVYNTHISSAVNSFAHIWGDKPFDKDITSADNSLVALVSVGEGWHNYHHTFPWDYKASELGWKINFSTMLIDLFAAIGWAYDLKVVSQEMLKAKIERSGDGTHPIFGHHHHHHNENSSEEEENSSNEMLDSCDSSATWGWSDEGVSDEYRKMTMIINPSPRTEAYQKEAER